MCWPAGSQSTIHDHDNSSCWVTVVEGSVHEVQFALPRLDRKFLEAEHRDPASAVGQCGELKVVNVAVLNADGGVTGTYANNGMLLLTCTLVLSLLFELIMIYECCFYDRYWYSSSGK